MALLPLQPSPQAAAHFAWFLVHSPSVLISSIVSAILRLTERRAAELSTSRVGSHLRHRDVRSWLRPFTDLLLVSRPTPFAAFTPFFSELVFTASKQLLPAHVPWPVASLIVLTAKLKLFLVFKSVW